MCVFVRVCACMHAYAYAYVDACVGFPGEVILESYVAFLKSRPMLNAPGQMCAQFNLILIQNSYISCT